MEFLIIHHHNHVTDKKQLNSTCSAVTDKSSLNITKQSNTELLLSSYKNISDIHQTYWSTSLHILIPGPQTSVRLFSLSSVIVFRIITDFKLNMNIYRFKQVLNQKRKCWTVHYCKKGHFKRLKVWVEPES